jgi:hypothetical protein
MNDDECGVSSILKQCETGRKSNIIYNKWTHRFLTVDTVLAPTAKCVDTRMNLRANEKTKKYQFLFTDGDEDVKRFFFPIVVTTDATLHKSAYDLAYII